MFTIKYIYPTGQEMLSGPYDQISVEWQDKDGNSVDPYAPAEQPTDCYRVVCAHLDGARGLMLGPNVPVPDPGNPAAVHHHSKVYVMNETGATVAKYEL
jgi:hypothetical protein